MSKGIRTEIDKALFSGDSDKLSDILKGLQKESEWLKSNEGLEKLIKTLEND
jgi:hypothetical protein